MKRITVLEPNVANKIAAGEVVERPASIVKELAENSIDAGSTAITIEIRGGGIDYIRITDNGIGIAEDDTENAFLRHATSKLLSANDLEHIETLGFRGEALASISAVSKLTMRTRTAEGEYGKLVRVEGGRIVSNTPCGCPVGTAIEVTELFYNVPARLKFLKSSRGEAAMIGDYIVRLILSNPSIMIKFINNGKIIYQSSGDGRLENALFCVYGNEIASKLYPLNYDDGYLQLTGYIGSELLAKNTRNQQNLFVNHRYIKSQIVAYAVQRAFETRLMHGKFPFFVINMLISCYEVDVNVHPNKLSVRFKNEDRISFAITRAVSDALNGANNSRNSVESKAFNSCSQSTSSKHISNESLYRIFGNNQANSTNDPAYSDILSMHSDEYSDSIKEEKADSGQSDSSTIDLVDCTNDRIILQDSSLIDNSNSVFDALVVGKDVCSEQTIDTIIDENEEDNDYIADYECEITRFDDCSSNVASEYAPTLGNMKPIAIKYGNIPVYRIATDIADQNFEAPEQTRLSLDSCVIIGVAFDTYIIVQQDDDLYYIDQHAAHERILYEKLVKNELHFDSQLLLVPEYVRLDPVYLEILTENRDRFNELGFSFDLISDTSVQINAIPSVLSANSEGFIADAVSLIINNGKVSEIDLVRSRLIQASCKKAVKAGDRLEKAEIEEILRAYASGEIPLTCPHGRPVIIKVTKTELQKQFKRIV